jgi:hypothetical protein
MQKPRPYGRGFFVRGEQVAACRLHQNRERCPARFVFPDSTTADPLRSNGGSAAETKPSQQEALDMDQITATSRKIKNAEFRVHVTRGTTERAKTVARRCLRGAKNDIAKATDLVLDEVNDPLARTIVLGAMRDLIVRE